MLSCVFKSNSLSGVTRAPICPRQPPELCCVNVRIFVFCSVSFGCVKNPHVLSSFVTQSFHYLQQQVPEIFTCHPDLSPDTDFVCPVWGWCNPSLRKTDSRGASSSRDRPDNILEQDLTLCLLLPSVCGSSLRSSPDLSICFESD